jgi:hypothetical protein
MAPTDEVLKNLSETFFHDSPASSVFHTPPPTPPK